MNELGNRLMLEKSWISRAVESLAQRDLVGKTENPADARSWLVSLTAAGLRRARGLNHTLDGHASSLLAPLSERERRQVQRALSVLLGVLRDDAEPAACS